MAVLKALLLTLAGWFVPDLDLVARLLVFLVAVAVCLRNEWIGPQMAAVMSVVGVATLLIFDVVKAARIKARGRR